MRKLGAVIDLKQGTCFSQTFGKAIPLKQGSTGLLIISLAELCRPQSTQALVAPRVVDQPDYESLESHTNQARCHGDDLINSRCSLATAQDPPDAPDATGLTKFRGAAKRRTGGQGPATEPRHRAQPQS